MMDLQSIRREYLQGHLRRSELNPAPLQQFSLWLEQAIDMQLEDPTAMVVATVGASGQPSQRIVLLKSVDERGFIFYTNYESRKARELDDNPKVSLHFPWTRIERQVLVGGIVEKIEPTVSASYFQSRPRESQLGAWASQQSRKVASRDALMEQFTQAQGKFDGQEIPAPAFWGGYRVVPTEMEFWQGGAHRMHDRFHYTLDAHGLWQIARLAP
ncbi:pyridoxamine 5'-phosphate oxidase [Pseudohongiella nitratireducens]|uniref:pyridoxamine 5'-phosphate oxidase n=1 Tax=Pseudohongiella nitratireducens TaxID=1768907 RepID=UPI0030ED96FB